MSAESDELYARLQTMYEMMHEYGETQDLENAIFEYEDCVTEEDFNKWKEKYSYFL